MNAPETSIHKTFASRSEPRSGGMMRILTEGDLRTVERADLYLELWGGHAGTANKRFIVNGRSLYPIPEVGTAANFCTHQYPTFNLPITDLVNGYNAIQFACDLGSSSWGHFIVDNACLRLWLLPSHPDLATASLSDFNGSVKVTPDRKTETIRFELKTSPASMSKITEVWYQTKYYGYDENGNTYATDWHGMTRHRRP